MPTANVNLSTRQARFIRQVIKNGRFQNSSEVMRAGLSLLEVKQSEDKLRLQLLRKLVQEGIDDIENGDFETLDSGSIGAFMESLKKGKRVESARQTKRRGK
jgi:antitoxin ParD1/3/4